MVEVSCLCTYFLCEGGGVVCVASSLIFFFFSSRRRHTRCALVTGVQTCALPILSEETAFYAGRAGVIVSQVTVGDPRGRWGSCAASGAIRYSWRLILAPDHVRRATVAHEVEIGRAHV